MYFIFAVIQWTESESALVREENDTVLYAQFLAIDTRSSSTCSCWISTLNHKILFEPSWAKRGLCTDINIRRWYDGIRPRCSTRVSQVLRSFCTSNNISRSIWFECWARGKNIHEVHGPNTAPVAHRPNLSQVRLSPCLLHSSSRKDPNQGVNVDITW